MRTNMNKNLFIYIFLIVSVLFVSCNWPPEPEEQTSQDEKRSEVISDELRERFNEQDSLSRELVGKIDLFTSELRYSKMKVENLQSEVKELKTPGQLLAGIALFSLLLGIVAIVVAIIRTNKKVERWEVKDMLKQMYREQIKDLEYRMTRAETNIKELDKDRSTLKSTPIDNSFDKRLIDLEKRMRRIEHYGTDKFSDSSYSHSSTASYVAHEPDMIKIGYAKVNSKQFFVDILSSKQEDCVYIIKFISKELGEFDIISLDKIKSINGIKDVVELTSDSCQLEEATNYNVIEKGRCKKADEKVWEVTKKLTIKVFK